MTEGFAHYKMSFEHFLLQPVFVEGVKKNKLKRRRGVKASHLQLSLSSFSSLRASLTLKRESVEGVTAVVGGEMYFHGSCLLLLFAEISVIWVSGAQTIIAQRVHKVGLRHRRCKASAVDIAD